MPEFESTPPPRMQAKDSSTIKLWLMLLATFVGTSVTTCGCAFTTPPSIVVILPFFIAAHIKMMSRPLATLTRQILGSLAYSLILAILIQFFLDLLIFGHNPILLPTLRKWYVEFG